MCGLMTGPGWPGASSIMASAAKAERDAASTPRPARAAVLTNARRCMLQSCLSEGRNHSPRTGPSVPRPLARGHGKGLAHLEGLSRQFVAEGHHQLVVPGPSGLQRENEEPPQLAQRRGTDLRGLDAPDEAAVRLPQLVAHGHPR